MSDANRTRPLGIAVVVPTFGPAPYLRASLTSIAAQGRLPDEVVVVDDGSVPAVKLPLTRLPVRLIRIDHVGIAGARNAGVLATSAPLVHICDHDDLLEPTFIERMAALLTADVNVDVAYSVCGYIGPEGDVLSGQLPYQPPPNGNHATVLSTLLSENYIASVAAVFRREAFVRIGGFRPLDYVQDWDFWLRLASTGSRFAHIPQILAWHRVHPRQQSRETQRIEILEESLGMIDELQLPARMWYARRQARARMHLQASRILRARGEHGALKHLVTAGRLQPIEATRAALRALR